MKLPKFRSTTIAGGGIFSLSLVVLGMVYFKPELADNDLFKMLAQAIVVQGLVGLAMAYYFTAKEHRSADPAPATGQAGDPVHVTPEMPDDTFGPKPGE